MNSESDNYMCHKCKKNFNVKSLKKLCYHGTECEVCLLHAYTKHIHYLCANCYKRFAIKSGKYDKV